MRGQVDTVKWCLRLGTGVELSALREFLCYGQMHLSCSMWSTHASAPWGGGEEHTYIPYCFIERFESGLLIVMVDASVPVQDGHAFPLSFFAVTSVHAVIRAVVPLAGEHIQTLWWGQEKDVSAVSARSPLCAWGLNPRSQNCTPHVISVLVSVTGTHGPTFTVFRPYSEIRN